MKKIFVLLSVALLMSFYLNAKSIVILKPDGGPYERGNDLKIVWRKAGAQHEMVKIRIFNVKTGRRFDITNKAPNKGNFTWRIPVAFPTSEYYVRIRTLDNSVFCDSKHFLIKSTVSPIASNLSPKQIEIKHIEKKSWEKLVPERIKPEDVVIVPKRKIYIGAKLAVRQHSATNISLERTFYLNYDHKNGPAADDLEVLVDGVVAPKRPGVPGGYGATPIPYTWKSNINFLIRKKISDSPLKYSNIAQGSGSMTPVAVTSPPPGYVLNPSTTPNLVITWSPGSDTFSYKFASDWLPATGNSISIPSSNFAPASQHTVTIYQKMTDLTLSGNFAAGSHASNIAFYFITFSTE